MIRVFWIPFIDIGISLEYSIRLFVMCI